MYNIGEKILYPMHGAGVIEDIETQEIMGDTRDYYVLRMPMDGMMVKIPVDNAETIGVRDIISIEETHKVMSYFETYTCEFNNNWNKRYRDNMQRIRSGDLLEVASVIKSLVIRENCRGLSTGERKMLHLAKQILISEIVLCLNSTYTEIEERLNNMFSPS